MPETKKCRDFFYGKLRTGEQRAGFFQTPSGDGLAERFSADSMIAMGERGEGNAEQPRQLVRVE